MILNPSYVSCLSRSGRFPAHVAVFGLGAFALFCGPRPSTLWEHHKAKVSLMALNEMNDDLRREIDALNEDIRRWRNADDQYREHVLRDELGWLRPGEFTMVHE